MNSINRKRKHRSGHNHTRRGESPPELQFLGHHDSYQGMQEGNEDEPVNPLRSLYIQAYEADVVHGPNAVTTAQSLEVYDYRLSGEGVVELVPKIGSALIQLGSSTNESQNYEPQIENADDSIPTSGKGAQIALWVDRYDIRLLLDTHDFNITHVDRVPPASPGGWSDIPSDAEDTFFFTPDEMEDFHREKRRRLLEQLREERLKARLEEDGVDQTSQDEDVWGGSDEEPDEVQKELMRRTAVHLLSSPNPAQLEMRILANHGGDRRFAFLRGRWGRAWKLAKAKARLEKEKPLQMADKPGPASLGVLAGYGSNSEDSDAGESRDEEKGPNGPERGGEFIEALPPSPLPPALVSSAGDTDPEELAREARRQRLKQWTEARRAKDTTG